MFNILLFELIVFVLGNAAAFCYSEDNLSRIEYLRYGMTFADESLSQRLNRLETDYFGMSQTGDINKRIENLAKINQTSKSTAASPKVKHTFAKKVRIKTFLDNLLSYFCNNGYITGFTPSITSEGTEYEEYRKNIYENGFHNYRYTSPNFTTNSSIHIQGD